MLYLERYNSQRAGEFNVDTNKDVVEVNPWFGEIFAWKEPFKKLYNIDLDHRDLVGDRAVEQVV